MLLITSLLIAGCGGTKSEPAPAKEEEQTQEAEAPATEEAQEAETPVAEEPTAEETTQAEDAKEASPRYVKVSEVLYYILENGEKEPIVETKYEYDDHSNVILATSKDIHSDSVAGILVSTSEITYNYEYDENGNKLKSVQRTTYDHSQDYNELTQEYDETGKPIRGQYIFYSYTGDDGSLLETPKESVSNFTISYDGDQYTRTFTADDGAVFNTEEGFYANGELYATKFKAGESEGTYEYDEYNNRISATETSGDTTRTSTAEHEYEFDENWNIIAMTTTPSEENSQITRTEYTYQLIQ